MELINLEKEFTNIPEITKPLTIDKVTGRGIPGGLYDTNIFGEPTSKKYKTQFSQIYLGTYIISPVILNMLKVGNRKVYRILLENLRFSYDAYKNTIEIDPNGKYIGVFHIVKLFKEGLISISSSDSLIKKSLSNILKNSDAIIMDRILIPPPYYRPINFADGMYSPDEINDLYIDILKYTRQIKDVRLTERNLLQYSLLLSYIQSKVYELFEYMKNKVGGKFGIIRQKVISKTTDFSGRAVITGDPNLPSDRVLLPFLMAIKILKPFILHHMGKDINSIGKMIQNIYVDPQTNPLLLADKLIEDVAASRMKNQQAIGLLEKYLKKSMEGKIFLLKRDPSLHRDSWRSFYAGYTFDPVIKVPSLVLGGFNADFDGDQMAVFLPMTLEGQEDAKKLLYSNSIYSSSKYEKVNLSFSKENILGVYMLTTNYSKK